MKSNYIKNMLFKSITVSAILCLIFNSCDTEKINEADVREKYDEIEKLPVSDVRKNLVNTWWIDTLEIEIKYSHPYFRSHTTLVKFGELIFNSWRPIHPDITSNSLQCEAIVKHNNLYYPIRFEYLMGAPNLKEPEKSKLFSFIYPGSGSEQSANSWDLQNYSIIDNVEIIRINDNEYYLVGLNRGMKRMKIRRM